MPEARIVLVECATPLARQLRQLGDTREVSASELEATLTEHEPALLVIGLAAARALGLVAGLEVCPNEPLLALLASDAERPFLEAALSLRVFDGARPMLLPADDAKHCVEQLREALRRRQSHEPLLADGPEYGAGASERAASRLLQALFAVPDAAVIVHTLDGIVTTWSSGAERLYGWPASLAVGRNVELLVPQGEREALAVLLRSVAETGAGGVVAMRHVRRDGGSIPVNVGIAPIKDGAERVLGVCLLVHDRSAEEAAQRAAAHKERELADLLRVIAHDLRGPALTLAGLVDLFRGDLREYGVECPHPAQESLTRIESAARRVQRMLEDVATLSRLGSSPECQRAVDVDAEVRGLLVKFRSECLEHGIECQVARLPPALGEVERIRHVFCHVIKNAISHGAAKRQAGRVVISARPRAAGTDYIVFDNGPGIPQRFLEVAFDLFRKLESSDGTGAGLAIARCAARALGGDVALTSVEGEHTEVSIWLPLSPQ